MTSYAYYFGKDLIFKTMDLDKTQVDTTQFKIELDETRPVVIMTQRGFLECESAKARSQKVDMPANG